MIPFVFTHKLMNTVFALTNRSSFHNLVVPVRRIYRVPEARFDVLGGGIVLGLSIGVALLIRLILAN
jgi:hypothetical protein